MLSKNRLLNKYQLEYKFRKKHVFMDKKFFNVLAVPVMIIMTVLNQALEPVIIQIMLERWSNRVSSFRKIGFEKV